MKELLFGRTHPRYHFTMMPIALCVLYKVCKVERCLREHD
jgi:hypothetical protein